MQAEQPESSPTGATHAANLEKEGYSPAEEGVTHAQIVVVEADLSRQHQGDPTQEVHAQTVGAELEAISGEASQTPSKGLLTHKLVPWGTYKWGSQATRTRIPPKELLMRSQARCQGKQTQML